MSITGSFAIRELAESEDPGVHDVVFTGSDGVSRYSDDVYSSAEEAEEAKAVFEAAGEDPLWWDELTKGQP